jgi:hypothetical protein
MIVYPPIAIAYMASYYAVNVIYATNTKVIRLLILDVFIECDT